ncbi:SDR family NAD(P)-dependent oxidoreductase [Streptomyces sp. NPDC048720]|uniref:SDR family NAD(P)-dependent oxidoreductase n=1 Tax=Streptomyces sp. NPDC048720 TaxID=3365588 RepID=UPI0037126F75
MTTKTALVTGASSGIGEATALKLISLCSTVYGAARRTDLLQKLAERGMRPLAMDVTDDDSMRNGVDRVISVTGRIDVLVNNAGSGSYGALEDVSPDEARRQFDVNVFGAVRLIQIALPHMRAQRIGTVVNVTSMGGKIHTPLGGWYHGTKFASAYGASSPTAPSTRWSHGRWASLADRTNEGYQERGTSEADQPLAARRKGCPAGSMSTRQRASSGRHRRRTRPARRDLARAVQRDGRHTHGEGDPVR